MGIIKTNVMRILDKEKIIYEAVTYDVADGKTDGAAVAKKISKEPDQVFKTLVTLGHSKNIYVFVIPVEKELDLKKIGRIAGEKSMELLPLKDLQKTTGYIRGGCSPIGMKKLFKTYIHQTALEFDHITFSGGKIGVQVTMNPLVLKNLIQAEYGDLVK
ncbi:MAG: ybaK/ebsC protein [Clostridia bacterium]|jgi:Cys-tRNA(Pro)/Cys-tRNA(Cys) deacylase|nr:ybaK/ebsC protein [Clostridia bacterium]